LQLQSARVYLGNLDVINTKSFHEAIMSVPGKAPIKVVLTGAAGQIAYSLLPKLLDGSVFGADQPVFLGLLDIQPSMTMLGGVILELEDLAYPCYAGSVGTTDPAVAFKDADVCVFLGAFPRKEGMERKDVMGMNVKIFNEQGAAVAAHAKPTVKCLVVGNPANTNAAILLSAMGGKIPAKNVTALTRLDHNRATSQLAMKAGVAMTDVAGVFIWGNHSSTQYPDVRHATVKGTPALSVVDAAWLEGEFITKVQKRGAAIIEARKLSSAMSAAVAIADHLRDWIKGTNGRAVSMAIFQSEGAYGVDSDICYSFPVTCDEGEWTIVMGLPIDAFSKTRMDATHKELKEERALAEELIKPVAIN
jgi:malate dehydrogenase